MGLKVINSIPVSISCKNLLKSIKNGKKQNASGRIRKEIEKVAKEIGCFIEPKAVYKEMPVTRKKGAITLGDTITIKSQKLTELLNPCDKAVVFLVTIGPEIDQMIGQKMKSQPHYGYLLDAAASLAVEDAADYVHDSILKNLTDGEQATLRYSPGYCDWPLREQKKLFEILPNKKIGIQLSEHCFMSPRKSISGIIGISSNGSSGFTKNICRKCRNPDCPYRRIS